VEVERPKPAPLFPDDAAEPVPQPEPRVSPGGAALVLFAFTLPITAAWEPLAWAVGVVGALVVLALVIGWPLVYAAEKVIVPPED
jgi:hypothetical protein